VYVNINGLFHSIILAFSWRYWAKPRTARSR